MTRGPGRIQRQITKALANSEMTATEIAKTMQSDTEPPRVLIQSINRALTAMVAQGLVRKIPTETHGLAQFVYALAAPMTEPSKAHLSKARTLAAGDYLMTCVALVDVLDAVEARALVETLSLRVAARS